MNGESKTQAPGASVIATLLILAGIGGIVGSIVWWNTFYKQVERVAKQNFIDTSGLDAVQCLYRLDGPCGIVKRQAEGMGANAYDPRLLWASVAAIVLALFLIAFRGRKK